MLDKIAYLRKNDDTFYILIRTATQLSQLTDTEMGIQCVAAPEPKPLCRTDDLQVDDSKFRNAMERHRQEQEQLSSQVTVAEIVKSLPTLQELREGTQYCMEHGCQ